MTKIVQGREITKFICFCVRSYYLCHYEYRKRLGIVKTEMRFPFASALTFRYLCEYEDRLRFGIVKSEMRFPFAFALTFLYICLKLNNCRYALFFDHNSGI